jgi:hypothetical protein
MVKVGFTSYDSRVLPEMGAKVLFLKAATEAAAPTEKPRLTIPLTSLAERDGKKIAFIIIDNKASSIVVTTGRQMGSLVEVVEGLTPGEKVIDKLDASIADGVKVKVQ